MEATKTQPNCYDNNALNGLLMKASKLDGSKLGYLTKERWNELRRADGARNLKMTALGWFGRKKLVSEEEVARTLCKVGIASSVEEGKKLIPYFTQSRIYYSDGRFVSHYLEIDGLQDNEGRPAYTVRGKSDFLPRSVGW